jgi:hypothetical protein
MRVSMVSRFGDRQTGSYGADRCKSMGRIGFTPLQESKQGAPLSASNGMARQRGQAATPAGFQIRVDARSEPSTQRAVASPERPRRPEFGAMAAPALFLTRRNDGDPEKCDLARVINSIVEAPPCQRRSSSPSC